MTQDRARKKATRARMAASGEPYSVASRRLAGADPAGDAAAVAEVIDRLDRTLAAPSARMEYRTDLEFLPKDLTPGVQLVSDAVRSAWERVVPEGIRTWLRDAGSHQVAVGIIEPAAGRYQMTYRGGHSSKVYVNGEHFDGFDGAPLADWNKADSPVMNRDDPLAWLRLLLSATEARYAGDEILRGTPCRKVILSKILPEMRARFQLSGHPKEDPDDFTVWIDEEHIRQVQAEVILSDKSGVETKTLELWDFGLQVDSLDWTRFPGYPG